MTDGSDAAYSSATYGDGNIGYGDMPAIAVVDFQMGFTDPHYKLGGAPLIQRAVQNTARLLEVARRSNVPVANFYTAYTSEADMPYWKVDEVKKVMRHGHPATELDARTYDPDYDVKLVKAGASVFFQTPIASFLVKQRVDTLIVVGCVTSGCVRASIVDSFQHGFRTIVPEDGVGDQAERPHHDNLRDVGRRYADITDTDSIIEWIEAWRGRNAS